MYKKKSLGQHFLHNAHYLGAVADAASIQPGETVLEIGPGEGALTEVLLARGARVVAVEKDARLIPLLQEKFAKEITAGSFTLHEGDALETEVETLGVSAGEYKVVGNIPYYITGALFKKFLSGKAQPSTLVFLIQKEVAQRIAKNKKESILSLSIRAYGEPVYTKTVPRGAFTPAPDVDSAILLVKNISRKHFVDQTHEEQFFALVKNGFAQKRKLLRRNIEGVLGDSGVEKMLAAGISENARAEDVSLEQWFLLSKN